MIARKSIFLLILSLFMLSACGVSGEPDRIVEDYFSAIAAGDAVRAANLSCAAWEDRARIDADSFLNVDTTIVGLGYHPRSPGTVAFEIDGARDKTPYYLVQY